MVTSKPKRISVAAGVVHIIFLLKFFKSIANSFAYSLCTIVYKQLISNDLSYEINLSIIMINNYLNFAFASSSLNCVSSLIKISNNNAHRSVSSISNGSTP